MRKVYPFGGLLAEGDEQIRTRNGLTAGTKMASVKKTSDDAEKIFTTDATDQPVGAGYAEVDDIPDRLLILANRLQKALDSRRVAHGEHPRLQEELRRSLKRIEDEK